MLSALGNPQNTFKSIHIAGTNGKGSVAAMLSSILSQSHSVGLYTSPHLVKFNERIKVNNKDISDSDIDIFIEKMRLISEKEKISLSFFEFTTCLAFLYFAEKKVEYAVIEVGLGGRLDATNVITPILSIITSISLDHQHILGDTQEKIAFEKAGIIKKNVPVIVHNMIDFFRSIAIEREAPFISVTSAKKISDTLDSQKISWKHTEYTLGLLGEYQVENASLVLTAADFLQISELDIQKGLASVSWPGRMHILSEDPLILVDGAHNQGGIEKLSDFVKNIPNKKVLVVGLSEYRNPEIIHNLAALFDHVIITKGVFKAQEPVNIAEKLHIPGAESISDLSKAILRAKSCLKPSDFMLVTGSLYMIGEAMELIKKPSQPF